MSFRVTHQQFVANTVRYANQRNQELLKLQHQVSTGKRIHKPSDAPSKMVALITSRARVSRIGVDLENIGIAEGKLNQSIGQLESANKALREAIIVAIESPQATDDQRQTLAEEIQGILDQTLQVANSANLGGALFGGTSSELNPFQVAETDNAGRPTKVTYSGTSDRSSIVIGSIAVDVNYPGSELFGVHDRDETIYLGQTGVQHGQGTDSATDRGILTVRHTSTEYRGGAGVVSGASSSEDTLIGVRELEFDAAARTLSIGGAAKYFEAGDRNVRVVGLDGEVIHVDPSGLVGTGKIEVVGAGTLSVDNGASSVDIDFSANQIVVDSRTGAVTNVDTSNVRKAGVEHVDYPGTSDMFQTLINLRDDLLNTRNMTPEQQQKAFQRHQAELSRVQSQIEDSMGEQAISAQNLVALRERSEDYRLETQIQIGDIESVDFAEAVIQLQAEQNALQFTYAASAGLMGLNILDFLR